MMRIFHTKRRVIVALLFCFSSFYSCVKRIPVLCGGIKNIHSTISCEEGFEKVTVVNNTGLDGCGYMLQRADSSAFEVNNFHDSLKVEGKTFCIRYHVSKQQMSICMGGQIIDILEIRK